MKLKGKTVLVTGGARRIGAVIAEALSKRGAKVAIHSHQAGKGAFQADLSDMAAVAKLVEDVEKKMGPIQILINNAAIFEKIPFLEVREKDFDRHLHINLKAPFFLSQAVATSMLKNKEGKIINIADVSAFKPYLGFSHYSATKAGLIALTKSLARELAPHVQVNAIALGPTLAPESYSKEEMKKIADKTLLKKWGGPNEVANAVCFLIEGTDSATGSVLTIDGGRLLV